MQYLQGMDSKIVTLCNLDKDEGEIDESESIIAKILEYKGCVSAATKPSQATIMTVAESISRPTTGAPTVFLQGINTCLPKLVLPKFQGNVTAWKP